MSSAAPSAPPGETDLACFQTSGTWSSYSLVHRGGDARSGRACIPMFGFCALRCAPFAGASRQYSTRRDRFADSRQRTILTRAASGSGCRLAKAPLAPDQVDNPARKATDGSASGTARLKSTSGNMPRCQRRPSGRSEERVRYPSRKRPFVELRIMDYEEGFSPFWRVSENIAGILRESEKTSGGNRDDAVLIGQKKRRTETAVRQYALGWGGECLQSS